MTIDRLFANADHAVTYVVTFIIAFIPAGIARWAWYADQIRRGRRKLALSLCALETATALLCTFLGLGLVDYLEWPTLTWKTVGLVALISYIGPNGLFAIGLQFAQRRWPVLATEPEAER